MRVPPEYKAAIKQLMSGLNYELEDGKRHRKLVFSVGEKNTRWPYLAAHLIKGADWKISKPTYGAD